MALTKAQKGAAVAKGAAKGGAVAGTITAAISAGLKAAGPKVVGVLVPGAAVAAVGYTAYQAGKAAVQSAKRGETLGEMAQHAALGAVGIDDAVTKSRAAFEEKYGKPMALGGPKGETDEQRKARLGKNLGGSPNDVKLAIENEKRALEKAGTGKMQRYHERRVRALETQLGVDEGKLKVVPADKTLSGDAPDKAAPKEGLGARILHKTGDAIEHALFGDKKKADDALASELNSVKSQIEAAQKGMEKQASSPGPLYEKFQTQLEGPKGPDGKRAGGGLNDKQTEIANKIAARDKAELEGWTSAGMAVAGLAAGMAGGRAVKKAAEKAAAEVAKDVSALASRAASLVEKSPKGPLKGTIAGDKAAAAVTAAKGATSRPVISAAEAYAVPAIAAGTGAANFTYGVTHPEDPSSGFRKAEGMLTMAGGVGMLEGTVAARGIRAVMSPGTQAKIEALGNRLAREAKGGFEGVKRAVVRERTAKATASAQMAEVRGARDVAKTQIKATASVETEKVRGAGKVMVEGHKQAGEIRKAAKAAEPKSRVTYKTGKQHTQAEIASYQKRSVRMKSAYGSNKIASVPVNDNATTMASHGYKGASK